MAFIQVKYVVNSGRNHKNTKMFDISFGEIGLVGLVGLLVLGPKEMLNIVKSMQHFSRSVKAYYNEYISYLNSELAEDNAVVKVVYDNDGNPQHAFDIDKLKPQLKNTAND